MFNPTFKRLHLSQLVQDFVLQPQDRQHRTETQVLGFHPAWLELTNHSAWLEHRTESQYASTTVAQKTQALMTATVWTA